jgi:flagellin-like protein
MRKLLKSKKALSPVIAAIILIAVTVAVSIAVAAWMGSLSMGFMETKELTISNIDFTESGGAAASIDVDVVNTGTSAVTVTQIKVNGNPVSFTGSPVTVDADGATDTIVIPYTTWVNGNKYSVSLFANDGTMVASYTDTAPTA